MKNIDPGPIEKYKIIFAGNDVLFCSHTNVKFQPNKGNHIFYAEDTIRKRLIYAFIEAESEKMATKEAKKLLKDYYRH